MDARYAAGVKLARRLGAGFDPAGSAWRQGFGCAAIRPVPLGRAALLVSRNGGDDRLPVKGRAW